MRDGLLIASMEVYDCIINRRSIRSYLDRDIDEEAIHKIIEAARWSPSAVNRQPWEFIIVRNRALLQKIAEKARYGSFIADAPVAIAVVTDPSTKWHIIDGSTAVQNMTLAAWEMGIGTCWIGSLERDEVKEILGIPENLHLLTVLPFGYPAKVGKSTRKEIQPVVHDNHW
jgi:nitroreductase